MNKLTGTILTLPKMSGNVGAKTINIGGKGDDGATFTPSVSADGIISWTNDKDLPNPEPVNIKGTKGDKGDKGDRGLQGVQGIQGERGEQGQKGDKGDRGEQGIQGIQGAKGETGAQGQKGADGTPATHRWSGTTLYITSASGTSSADLKGEKGDRGEKGDKGADGAPGADGAKGDKGDKGDTGATGAQGPKGDTGDTGPQGPAGPEGAQGKPGKDGTDGKSAYAYAQDAGYTGTEAEFAKKLASESSGIHVGPDAPTDENVNVWIDTNEEPEEAPETGSGIDVTAEVGQTIIVEEVDENGKPTKWKAVDYQPRTHYSTFEEVQLLNNATVAGDGSSTFDFPIVAGQTYKVNWNGTSYEDVAFNYSLDGFPLQCIGNPAGLMGDDNGKPYFFFHMADMGVTSGMTMDGSDGVITLDVIDETVYKIPQKYVPDMRPYYVFAYIDSSDGMSFVTNETVENFTNAFNSGRAVWLRFVNNSGVIFIPLYSTSDGNRTVEFRTYGAKCVFTATDDGGYSMEIEFA